MTEIYRGRFAPSPTGPLHFGSLIAAVASFCQARAHQGEWLVRIEDIDPPREIAGAADAILKTLESFGLEWDAEVAYQSQRQELYLAALESLHQKEKLYPCSCSRKDISKISPSGVYPGTCRTGIANGKSAYTLRIRVDTDELIIQDLIQGSQIYNTRRDIGDFVVRRADDLFAYQLAVAIDDAQQGITEVVRGSDLLDSTPCQVYLHQQLGYQSPKYAHHPVIVDATGQKLSKQNLAPALDASEALSLLHSALSVLGQQPLFIQDFARPVDLLHWAVLHWDLQKIPKKSAIKLEEPA